MKKIHRHEKWSVMNPPSVGPMAGARTTAIPYTANAIPRLATGKVSARMACSLGPRPSPPSPCKTRKKIRKPSDGATPHRNELNVKMITHVM